MIEVAREPEQLDHMTSHVLRAVVTPGKPLRVRHDRVVAQVGALEFWRDGDNEQGARSAGSHGSSAIRERIKSLLRKVKPWVEAGLLSRGHLFFHRATGDGDIYLADDGGDITIFDMVDERLFVFKPSEILAHDESIVAELSERVDDKFAAVLGAARVWTLTGSGQFAAATNGEAVVLTIEPDRPMLVEVEAIAAASTGIRYESLADYKRRMVERGVAAALKYSPHVPLNVDVGRRRVWMVAHGQGQLVVRSAP